MKTKFLSALFCVVMLVSFSACEKEVPPVVPTPDGTTPNGENLTNAKTVTLQKTVAAFFTVSNSVDGYSNYNIVLAERDDVLFNSSTSTIEANNSHVLSLDIYSQETATMTLASGSYAPASVSEIQSGSYVTDYTYYDKYNSKGTVTSTAGIVGAVEVTRLEGNSMYRIKATAADSTVFVFEGRINFIDTNTGSYSYPQIQSDIKDVKILGGWAIYNGNINEENTGEMIVNLYDCAFDEATGAMLSTGHDIVLQLNNKMFGNPKTATLVPGTYTVARNFQVGTYFPGMEIDYMGLGTFVYGSYVKRRKAMTGGEGDYDYTYITNGTVTISDGENGTFNLVLDLMTADGFVVTGTATNMSVIVTDQSNDDKGHVSNLEEDVDLKLDYVKTARAWNNGTLNGCRRFLVDIGSPAGRDGTEGDIFRMEFLVKDGFGIPLEGTYEVMEYDHLYWNMFAPFKLVQGYFTGGSLDGTRYEHFEEGRTNIMQWLAPAVAGTVKLEKVQGTENYHFVINVTDDAGFEIKGEWTGPIEYMYNVEAITTITTETPEVENEIEN